MQRVFAAMIVFAMAPLLMGGGMAPPTAGLPAGVTLSPPNLTGTIVLDARAPEALGGPVTGNFATLWIRKGGHSAAGVFRTEVTWVQGCDPNATANRFLRPLHHWVPEDTLRGIFTGLGLLDVTPHDGGAMIPVVTGVNSLVCTPGDTGIEAQQSMDVDIQFYTLRK